MADKAPVVLETPSRPYSSAYWDKPTGRLRWLNDQLAMTLQQEWITGSGVSEWRAVPVVEG